MIVACACVTSQLSESRRSYSLLRAWIAILVGNVWPGDTALAWQSHSMCRLPWLNILEWRKSPSHFNKVFKRYCNWKWNKSRIAKYPLRIRNDKWSAALFCPLGQLITPWTRARNRVVFISYRQEYLPLSLITCAYTCPSQLSMRCKHIRTTP